MRMTEKRERWKHADCDGGGGEGGVGRISVVSARTSMSRVIILYIIC